MKVTFEKMTGRDKKTIKTAYFNSHTTAIINENDLNEELQKSKYK